MVGELNELLAAASRSALALEANLEIGRMREQTAQGRAPGLSYEVVVPAAEPWRHLTDAVLPRLVYFLDCRGQLAARTPGIFVSAFVGERLYFFDAGLFVELVALRLGLDLAQLRERWGERTGGSSSAATQKLLGGG